MAFNDVRASVLTVLAVVIMAGCATVQTARVGGDSAKAEGTTYFLPKRLVAINGTRTPLKKEDVQKKADAASKAINDAGAAKSKAETQLKDIIEALAVPGISDDRKKKLNDDKAIASARKTNAENAITQKAAELDDLNRTLQQFGQFACVFSYDIKLEAGDIVPDARARLVASLQHSGLRDDVQTFKVTSSGLLNSADVAATDHTGDILVEAAGAIGAFSAPTGVKINADFIGPPAAGANTCDTMLRAFKYLFDPVGVENPVNKELAKAGWPFIVDAILPPTAGSSPESLAPVDGLYYRTAAPTLLTIYQCGGGTVCDLGNANQLKTPIQASVVLLPQAGPISYIPMRSSAFVKTTDVVGFENGMLTSWSANRPSEVLEVVRLPVRALKALVSIPAEIIKLRVDYSSQEQSLASAYAKQLQAEETLRKAQDCLQKANASGGDGTTCFGK